MYHIFFDESKFPKKNFIIGAFVFCKTDPSEFIETTLISNGFNPLTDEYKSSIHFVRTPKMADVRETLKLYFHENCFFGIVILPHTELNQLGTISLNALKQFLETNNFKNDNYIYFDEGIFLNKRKAEEQIENLNLSGNKFFIEQDSKKIKGIQLADLCAHCLTTMLREGVGDLSKKVKVPDNSGYDPDDETEIGFDIWASIRYSFLRETNKIYIEGADQEVNCTYKVYPYGLYVSNDFDNKFKSILDQIFGTVYLGCIH